MESESTALAKNKQYLEKYPIWRKLWKAFETGDSNIFCVWKSRIKSLWLSYDPNDEEAGIQSIECSVIHSFKRDLSELGLNK